MTSCHFYSVRNEKGIGRQKGYGGTYRGRFDFHSISEAFGRGRGVRTAFLLLGDIHR